MRHLASCLKSQSLKSVASAIACAVVFSSAVVQVVFSSADLFSYFGSAQWFSCFRVGTCSVVFGTDLFSYFGCTHLLSFENTSRKITVSTYVMQQDYIGIFLFVIFIFCDVLYKCVNCRSLSITQIIALEFNYSII